MGFCCLLPGPELWPPALSYCLLAFMVAGLRKSLLPGYVVLCPRAPPAYYHCWERSPGAKGPYTPSLSKQVEPSQATLDCQGLR